jgi:hypothetical protein
MEQRRNQGDPERRAQPPLPPNREHVEGEAKRERAESSAIKADDPGLIA